MDPLKALIRGNRYVVVLSRFDPLKSLVEIIKKAYVRGPAKLPVRRIGWSGGFDTDTAADKVTNRLSHVRRSRSKKKCTISVTDRVHVKYARCFWRS